MGFFDTIFGKKAPERGGAEQDKEKKGAEWIPLTSAGQLDEIAKESASTAVVIFKHSTRCGISGMAYRNFKNDWDTTVDGIKLYYLDLLAHREVSNAIASRFGVAHESPQLLLLKDGEVIHHTSHGNISAQQVIEVLGA